MTKQNTTPNVDFSFVRYANCWEDAKLLVDALNPTSGKKFLSIASAGDNALSLLAGGAEVIAADLNPAQLACTELRKEAIRILTHAEFLSFCGIKEASDRLSTFNDIRPQLSKSARSFWDANQASLANGFIHAGKFENYFKLFRTRIMPLIHNRGIIQELLTEKPRQEREQFYSTVWNNRRWQWLFRLFFSKRIMGTHGRDPEFFKHVEGSVSDRILSRTKYALTELDTALNPYLTYILTGNFNNALPYYLDANRYQAIQKNINSLTLREGAIDSLAREYGPDSFDGFNLSDIFEYLSPEQCTKVYEKLLGSAKSGARLAYWNMLVPRACPQTLSHRMVNLEKVSEALFQQDQAFFYSRFVLEEVK